MATPRCEHRHLDAHAARRRAQLIDPGAAASWLLMQAIFALHCARVFHRPHLSHDEPAWASDGSRLRDCSRMPIALPRSRERTAPERRVGD